MTHKKIHACAGKSPTSKEIYAALQSNNQTIPITMCKIIASSSMLNKMLFKFLTPSFSECDETIVTINCFKKTLQFDNFSEKIFVETHNDWTVSITIGRLRKLWKSLIHIEDQPLVIIFKNEHDCIEIVNLLI